MTARLHRLDVDSHRRLAVGDGDEREISRMTHAERDATVATDHRRAAVRGMPAMRTFPRDRHLLGIDRERVAEHDATRGAGDPDTRRRVVFAGREHGVQLFDDGGRLVEINGEHAHDVRTHPVDVTGAGRAVGSPGGALAAAGFVGQPAARPRPFPLGTTGGAARDPAVGRRRRRQQPVVRSSRGRLRSEPTRLLCGGRTAQHRGTSRSDPAATGTFVAARSVAEPVVPPRTTTGLQRVRRTAAPSTREPCVGVSFRVLGNGRSRCRARCLLSCSN